MCNINDTLLSPKQILENDLRLNNLDKRELHFKIVVIGDFGVGKTSIIGRFTDGQFSQSYKITIGADFAIKSLEWDEETRVILQIWDIAGYERFGSLTGIFYRHAVAAAIVFDLTRPETFKSVGKWLKDLRAKVHLPGGKPVPVILLANKGDIRTDTVPDVIDDFCKNNKILSWFITSAKNNIQIDTPMYSLTNAIIENHNNSKDDSLSEIDSDIITLSETSSMNRQRKCCNI